MTPASSAVGASSEAAGGHARLQAGEPVGEGDDRTADFARDRSRPAMGRVRHQPTVSLSTAFAVGLAIGVAVGSTSRVTTREETLGVVAVVVDLRSQKSGSHIGPRR